MLEKPDLQDDKIIACLQHEFGLQVSHFTFLPLGADLNTAVYRAATQDEKAYFVKLRKGVFDETSVRLPKCLHDQGVLEMIAPLQTQSGKLWAELEHFKVILYAFIDGRNGYEIRLSDRHWRDFGKALKRIQTTAMSPGLIKNVQREAFLAYWRDGVKKSFERIDAVAVWSLPVAQRLAAYLQSKREVIFDLIERTEAHARALRTQTPAFVLCHADVHAGNILIDDADGRLYIVDWDSPILAPKERDLMYAGAGLFGDDRTPQEEEALFYEGYGATQVNAVAMAYYRYERIIEDIAVYCQQIFSATENGEDLEQSLRYLESNFLPGGTIEIAYQSDKT